MPETSKAPLTPDELKNLHAFWRACNYLAVGMIYLRDNPLLREPLQPDQIKERLLGHWGASPGLSFMYVHLNRLIVQNDVNAIFLAGLPSESRVIFPVAASSSISTFVMTFWRP